jgi:hypothetical protein
MTHRRSCINYARARVCITVNFSIGLKLASAQDLKVFSVFLTYSSSQTLDRLQDTAIAADFFDLVGMKVDPIVGDTAVVCWSYLSSLVYVCCLEVLLDFYDRVPTLPRCRRRALVRSVLASFNFRVPLAHRVAFSEC